MPSGTSATASTATMRGDNGHYVLGPDVTINGISGSDIEALKDYINMRLSGEKSRR